MASLALKVLCNRGDYNITTEGSGFDKPYTFSEPNRLQEKIPLYAPYGVTGFSLFLFLGTFIWIHYPPVAIDPDLQRIWPNFTNKVPPLPRSALWVMARTVDVTEGRHDDRSRVLNVPK